MNQTTTYTLTERVARVLAPLREPSAYPISVGDSAVGIDTAGGPHRVAAVASGAGTVELTFTVDQETAEHLVRAYDRIVTKAEKTIETIINELIRQNGVDEFYFGGGDFTEHFTSKFYDGTVPIDGTVDLIALAAAIDAKG